MPGVSGEVWREEVEAREDAWLAPFAMRVTAGRGRCHPAGPDPHRTAYARDRDRIIHARAFRRLAYKTQVFPNEQGDLYRTRLTHTMEVTQLARTAARRLRLNEDLVECIALVHDLGHPPFGHRGEATLDELLDAHGGFEHNRHTLRLVDELEIRYPDFPGLNLTYEVREAILKHAAGSDGSIPRDFHPGEAPLLEARLVDAVDSIAYDCHDIDDGLRAGVITPDDLANAPLWDEAWQRAVVENPPGTQPRLLRDRAIRILIDHLLGDLVASSARALEATAPPDVRTVRALPTGLIGGGELRAAKEELEDWLLAKLYRAPTVNAVFLRAQDLLRDLYRHYLAHPEDLPADHRRRITSLGAERTVGDYLAGMTDRFAREEHERLSA